MGSMLVLSSIRESALINFPSDDVHKTLELDTLCVLDKTHDVWYVELGGYTKSAVEGPLCVIKPIDDLITSLAGEIIYNRGGKYSEWKDERKDG